MEKDIDPSSLYLDLIELFINKEILNLKERYEVFETIVQISNNFIINSVKDLLKYCIEALINFEAYSKELTIKNKNKMAIWSLECTGSYEDYDLYTCKKIELAYLKKLNYIKIDDTFFIDLRTMFQIRFKCFHNYHRRVIRTFKDNKKIKEETEQKKQKEKEKEYTKWFWNNKNFEDEKKWEQFNKKECLLFEDYYLRGIQYLELNGIKYNINKMIGRIDNEKYPSKYLKRTEIYRYKPLELINNLKKEQYQLLESKINLLLHLQENQNNLIKENINNNNNNNLIEITPCLYQTLKTLLEKISNNNLNYYLDNQK